MFAKPKRNPKKSRHISNPKPTVNAYCEICGTPYAESHEVYGGRNRNNSIKYKMQIRLCHKHHAYVQDSPRATEYRNELKQKYQRIFEENYGTREEFIKVFGRNYLED